MYFPRAVEAKLRRLTRYFPAVVVTGARQSGKTTLLRLCYPDRQYVSMDLPSRAAQAEGNPGDFLTAFRDPVIIDEVQYAPGLLRHLKVAIDQNRHAMGRYLLTGSQHFSLMKGVTESLAGRVGVIELENLSLFEIDPQLTMASDRTKLLRLLARGQFPELWRLPDFPASDFYGAYLATYLERDVRQILNVGSLRDFERFIRVLAARSGNVLNKSDVARDVGVSIKAISDWISVLQASGQIVLLEPWFANIGKRVVKTPKVYFCDTGMLCFLLNLTEETLVSSPHLGAVWETFIYAELRKRIEVSDHPGTLWFYRDQRAREIDFVVESGGNLSFVEAKWQEHPSLDDARFIQQLSRELKAKSTPERPGRHWVVGTPQVSYPLSDGVMAIGVGGLSEVVP